VEEVGVSVVAVTAAATAAEEEGTVEWEKGSMEEVETSVVTQEGPDLLTKVQIAPHRHWTR
tara:strand:- start:7126 stop:7308 length:183 start_codon:yes stop_codon:yes gene_type:complete